ncbi:MAG: cytochrome c3 family protein [Deltaproteobacteria bacterium]|nr:cytochrome c3 family protein [Deltaproteobacteria bacterium]
MQTTIGNCLSCHREVRREMSHPVDVYPAPGMRVPKEYPLLANGKMSCISCHVRHAGDNLYRLVRAQGRQFCQGCHATY